MGYMDDGEATMPNTRDEVRGSTPVSPRRICDSRALRDRRSTTSSRSRLTARERNLMSRWSSARNVWHIARISGTPTWRGCASCASMARKWPRFEIWPPNSQPRSSPSTPSSSCLSFSPAVCWSRSTPRPRSVRPPTCAQPTPFPRQCAHRSAPILLKSCPQASGLFPWARGPLQPHLHSRAALDRFSRPLEVGVRPFSKKHPERARCNGGAGKSRAKGPASQATDASEYAVLARWGILHDREDHGQELSFHSRKELGTLFPLKCTSSKPRVYDSARP